MSQIDYDPAISMVDSFPVPLCRFARAARCKLMPEAAAYGDDELARQTFYGFRTHVRICWPGVIVAVELTPANIHDLTAVEYLIAHASGWVMGDRNYWSPRLTAQLAERDVILLAPSNIRPTRTLFLATLVDPFTLPHRDRLFPTCGSLQC